MNISPLPRIHYWGKTTNPVPGVSIRVPARRGEKREMARRYSMAQYTTWGETKNPKPTE